MFEIRPQDLVNKIFEACWYLSSSFVLQPLGTWDVAYLTQAAKHRVLCDDSDQHRAPVLAQYFPLGAVMQGLNTLLQQLYQVSLQPCKPEQGELWSDDVTKLAGE